ncbi:TRAP transporter small permease [Rhodococcus sp. IEGM 1408]|uniref:TRAP transporter small permease subunit n=1 Tax=Rhodococcus sp. IEGM 1408 TaxID=3082220 RepID=UPI002954BF2D|nr:TRAP transporter small permease [Rhodococcus sp. IEGM 1408]MDV8001357.1 TRAP transporter small permease [Rhodococcus sp. IEGM 1408]
MDTTTTDTERRVPGQRALARVLYACAVIAGLVTLFMALHIAADVTSRNLTGTPLSGTLEITQNWSMVLIVMLAMGYAEQVGEHINATILTQYLDPVSQWWSDLIVKGLMFLFVSALTYYSITAAVFAVEVQQVALGAITIPIWPVKILLAIGFALFALQLLMSIISLLINDRPRNSDV